MINSPLNRTVAPPVLNISLQFHAHLSLSQPKPKKNVLNSCRAQWPQLIDLAQTGGGGGGGGGGPLPGVAGGGGGAAES
jgi:hypothetical protein